MMIRVDAAARVPFVVAARQHRARRGLGTCQLGIRITLVALSLLAAAFEAPSSTSPTAPGFHPQQGRAELTTGIRRAGDFCWINMLTPRPDEARAFFSRLLAWSYVELPGMGHSIQVGGRDIGGLFDLAGSNTPKGTPPQIGIMVKVDSADATSRKVASLGGRALPAFDVMDQGRMAVCFDGDDRNFDVWEPRKNPGTDVDSRLHGAPAWFETATTNVERVAGFYSALFGWVAEPPGKANYTLLKHGTGYVAGVTPLDAQAASGMRSGWLTYFAVADLDATSKLALELGARVDGRGREIPKLGRAHFVTSPQGVRFGVIQHVR